MLPRTAECRKGRNGEYGEESQGNKTAHLSRSVIRRSLPSDPLVLRVRLHSSVHCDLALSKTHKQIVGSKKSEKTATGKYAQTKVELHPIASKARKISPHSRGASFLSKPLHALKGNSTGKLLPIPKNLSMDLEDFEEIHRPKFDILHAKMLVSSQTEEKLQRRETWHGVGRRTSRRGERDSDLLCDSLNDGVTLRPSESHVPLARLCSCPPQFYRQKHLHYRQLFAKKGPLRPLSTIYPIYIDKYPGISLKPSLILLFDGVLGDFYKRCLTDTSPKSIRLRKNSAAGLQWLQQAFNLVFVTALSRSRAMRILNYFRKKKVSFLAAYRIFEEKMAVLDYGSVLGELGLSETTTMVVGSLELSYDDLEYVSEESLFVMAGTELRLMAKGLPVAKQCPLVTLLVPSLRMNVDTLPFDAVVASIHHFRKSHTWESDFRRLQAHPSADLTPISTSVVQEMALSSTLNFPKADTIRRGVVDACTLHSTPQWVYEDAHLPLSPIVVLTQRPAPGSKCGFDVIESKALRIKTGFLTLLDYTTAESRGKKRTLQDSV